jgi:hypothetical protein
MGDWICKNCGRQTNSFWHFRGGLFQWFLGIIFVPFEIMHLVGYRSVHLAGKPDPIFDFWKYFQFYRVCDNCNGHNLCLINSIEGKETLGKFNKSKMEQS